MVTVGAFVWAGTELGIGKVIQVDPGGARVRFFWSPHRQTIEQLSHRHLERIPLWSAAKVWLLAGERTWVPCRIELAPRREETHVTVRLPDGTMKLVSQASLELDCRTGMFWPATGGVEACAQLETLAHGGFEAQPFADLRLAATRAVMTLESASQGLGGLVSSSVELLPHQLEVVRRICEDPMQRYLLADEVGLGKTIEAGAVIRQCQMDQDNARILVLVPESIREQWRRELRARFHIIASTTLAAGEQQSSPVTLLPHEALGSVAEQRWDLAVIDEAHLLLRLTKSSDDFTRTQHYHQSKRLSLNATGLLLLSAIPLVGNEDAMHGLLHLLDAESYPLNERNLFRHKVQRSQDVVRALISLDPQSGTWSRRRHASHLRELFPNDSIILNLVSDWANEDCDTNKVSVALKQRIAETYRLDHRIIRSRRVELEQDGRWRIKPRAGMVEAIEDLDPRTDRAWMGFADWAEVARERAVSHPHESSYLTQTYKDLIDALGQGVDVFLEAIDTLLAESSNPGGMSGRRLLKTASDDLASGAWRSRSRHFSRVQAAVTAVREAIVAVRKQTRRPAKVVVFASSTAVALATAQSLAQSGLGVSRITEDLDGVTISNRLRVVRRHADDAALVCDRTGEHGLNLQWADAIVHVDVPFEPTRMEQRVGRLDRIGRRGGPILHRVVVTRLDPASPWRAWYELLRDGLRVFREPISDVQFYLDRLEAAWTRTLFWQGIGGLARLCASLPKRLEAERDDLREQALLNALWMSESTAPVQVTELESIERDANLFVRPLEDWIRQSVALKKTSAAGITSGHSYQWIDDHVTAPRKPWKRLLDQTTLGVLTFDREAAVDDLRLQLVGPGTLLLMATTCLQASHDRGRAFGTWRVEPSWSERERGPWVGFRLTYRVHARTSGPGTPTEASAQRRVNRFLHPFLATVVLDADLNEVDDEVLSDILARPFRAPDATGAGDRLLGELMGVLFDGVDGLLDRAYLESLCHKLAECVEGVGLASKIVQSQIRAAGERAAVELGGQQEVLKQRLASAVAREAAVKADIAAKLAMNTEIRASLTRPQVHLETAGLFIVSSRPPTRH